MHRRCIGCGENTRLGSSPRTRPQRRSGDRINKSKDPHLLVRPGSHFPAPAVRFATARRARTSQGRPLLQRSPVGFILDRPSTVLLLQEAVTIIGMVLVKSPFLRQRSSPVRAETRGLRPGGARSRGQCSRAAERDSRPFGEEPPEAWLIPDRGFRAQASRPIENCPGGGPPLLMVCAFGVQSSAEAKARSVDPLRTDISALRPIRGKGAKAAISSLANTNIEVDCFQV